MNDLSEFLYQRSKWREKPLRSCRIVCSDDFTKYFVNIFMYLMNCIFPNYLVKPQDGRKFKMQLRKVFDSIVAITDY